jgi:hypothetical protein
MTRYPMRNVGKAALLVVFAVAPLTACIDPEPVVVVETKVTPSPACLACLTTPDVPGPGCGDEITTCKMWPTCSRSYDCALQGGCIGGPVKTLVACLPACTRAAGFESLNDPGRTAGLRVFECLTRAGCASSCFTDGADGGVPMVSSDASSPQPDGEPDGPVVIGDACVNPSDEAVASDMPKVQQAAQTCGLQCFAQAEDCAGNCLETTVGFSKACASCWGTQINCVTQNCLTSCLRGAEDPECQTCTQEACTPAFHGCTGT